MDNENSVTIPVSKKYLVNVFIAIGSEVQVVILKRKCDSTLSSDEDSKLDHVEAWIWRTNNKWVGTYLLIIF